MRKLFIYIFVFILLCYVIETEIKHSIAEPIDHGSPYCLSFTSIGAILLESRLDCWAKIKTANHFQELDAELIMILQLLDLPFPRSAIMHEQQTDHISLFYHATKNQTDYFIRLQTESQNTYFLLTAISSQDDLALHQDEKRLKERYQSQSYFQYKGMMNERPDQAERRQMLQVVCQSLQARAIDHYSAQNMDCMAAFSPLLRENYDQVKLAGENYNLQAAIRNDSVLNQSYIYLGVPLLLNDY